MSITIVDKRTINRDRTTENRQRFLKRIKATIKEQLPKIIGDRSLRDIDKKGGKIRINRKTINEPVIHHGDGGNIDRVLPGNDEYVEGDLVPKPYNGGGSGRGTNGEDTEDDFIVELSREEFLREFFEDLELPEMLITDISKIKEYKRKNAGFQSDGSPNRLSVERSYKQSFGRRITLRGSIDHKVNELQKILDDAKEDRDAFCDHLNAKYYTKFTKVKNCDACPLKSESAGGDGYCDSLRDIEKELVGLKSRKEKLPMFEEMDLRYRFSLKQEIPVTHATMVMIMDNSGSMGQKEKTIARKFFWLLFKFLEQQYEQVDMIFISHTETAVEMDENEFFNTRISGGTIVSSALDLTSEIIKERLSGKTNIYVAQVSDGDNSDIDNGTCAEILEDEILPEVRYFAYVQVDDYHDYGSNPTLSSLMHDRGLWKTYRGVAENNSKLQAKRVFEEKDIYQVFKDLFTKKGIVK